MKQIRVLIKVAIVIMFLSTTINIAMAHSDIVISEIDITQNIIDIKEYNWTAGMTSVSELTITEKQRLCGAKIADIPENTQFIQTHISEDTNPTLDWRDKGCKN